ncbi:hypothetical protein [Blastococcus sp. CT_GayMR20]|uniref:hypothetical protein n=1 Tax=Blastococcus sp. CT_GayMR20 TaxID=2559609 RepID=UPI0010749499|nr:hypothetical protein [Blastococcus sp. CT_GayMR20]
METTPWTLLRLGNGQVLLRGSALVDVVRALVTAQQVTTRRDGIAPNQRWLWLQEQLTAEASAIPAASPPGNEEVPQIRQSASWSPQLINTEEAAAMLACTARNVRHLCQRGVLESGRTVGGRLLLDRLEVEAEVHRRAEARRIKESA